MIGTLRNLARRRDALVALSDAQRALIGLELHDLRHGGWSGLVGRRGVRIPGLSAGIALAAVASIALVVARPRRLLKLASAALAVYPLIGRLLALVRTR